MFNNSLAFKHLTSELVNNCFKLKTPVHIPSAQSYLKVPASLWIRLLCFPVQRYLCKTTAEIY